MILIIALNFVIFVTVFLPKPVTYNGKTVAQWAADLNGGDQKTRDEAADAFKELGARAVPHLTALLRGKDSWFRKNVFAVAPKLPLSIRRLLLSFAKPIYWPDVHLTAARALGIIGQDATEVVPLLDEALRDSDRGVSMEAAVALGKIGKDSVPFLIRALKHERAPVRHMAAYALGQVGTNAAPAIPALVESIGDSDEYVRSTSAFALIGLGERGRKELLQVIVEREGVARRTAIGAAVATHSPDEFIPAILDALKDADATNRLAAASALGAMNPWKEEVVAAMTDLLKDPDASVRLEAAKNLGKAAWKARAAIPALTGLLNDPDEAVRTTARETLDKINSTPVPQAQAK